MKGRIGRFSLALRWRLFIRRVTPVTWLIWGLLLADLLAPGYGKLNLVVTTVDLADAISIVRTGKPHAKH